MLHVVFVFFDNFHYLLHSFSVFHTPIQSAQSVDIGRARSLQNQLEQRDRQLHASKQELQRVSSELEESRKSLESEVKREKETRGELEVRVALVEEELFKASEEREKLDTDLTELRGELKLSLCVHR